MDPDIILILGLILMFLVFSIYSTFSFFKRNSPITGKLTVLLCILFTCTLLLFSFLYNVFYNLLNDFTLIVFYVILVQAFFISINISQLILKKANKTSNTQKPSMPLYVLTILLSLFITVLFYYSVGLIDSANFLGNE